MRKHVKEMKPGPSARSRRFQIMSVAAVVLVFAIAATAISLQASKAEKPGGDPKLPAGSTSPSTSLPLRSAQEGQFSQAQIRPLTQAEAEQMAEGLRNLVNNSTEGLKEVHHADGSVSMDLQGRFQSVALARKAETGNVAQSCVDNPEAAAAFLGINRELIDGVKTGGAKLPARHLEALLPEKGQGQ